MDADRLGSRRERSEERYRAGSPVRESTEGAFDDTEEYDKDRSREITKHRSKDRKKSRKEDKEHRSRGRDRSKPKDELKEKETDKDFEKERISIKERRKEEKEEHEKDRTKDKNREKDSDRDKHRGKDHERDRDEKDRGRKKDRERERDNEPENNRGREKDRGKEKGKEKEEREKEKTKDRDRGKDRERDKEKEKTRDRERERDYEKNKGRDLLDREQVKDISREREREVDHEKERSRDKEKVGRRSREDQDHSKDEGRDTKARKVGYDNKEREISELGNMPLDDEGAGLIKQGDYVTDSTANPSQSRMEVAERILRIKEERLKKTSEVASEILSWVHKSRKLEEKSNSEKEKALRRSKILEEQDNLDEDDNELDTIAEENANALAGVKVLHGVDKVLEGGSVVLTLKDQDILANGDLNEDVDMLENVEIGEQKRRSDAYKSAKKSSGIYVDKFNDELGEEKKMLPQYDDPAEEEGVVLDAAGRFAGEAEKKLEELRRRLQGPPMNNQAEDSNASVRISSDYYTPEEMLQFRKPKKKKSLRKKDKLDLDALEAEAKSTGLGASDLGSRRDSKRQAAKEEEERHEAERRKSAYQAAFSKADDASKALRMELIVTPDKEDNDSLAFADDAEDLQMSMERARKLALKKQNEKALIGPEAVARLASLAVNNQATDAQNSNPGDASDNKVVFTEMEEFVWGLQLDEEAQKPYDEDVFMEEDEAPKAFEEKKDETGGWSEVVDSGKDEQLKSEDEEDVVPDETLHEVPVGKGLSGVLKLLKDRGTLKETIEWGGRNMDKKKSKLVGIHDEEGGPKQIRMDKKKGKLVDEVPKEINLERLDEFGRVLTPKQAFRLLSHKFHGKGPGKMKQEKRMKQYHDELKQKQMTSTDVIPQSVDRMREAQAQLKTPYLVLSGHVKPGQTSDPRSGFATVEKEVPGSLTPMLGDKKVEHFLGIKRKAESGSYGTPKKPKT